MRLWRACAPLANSNQPEADKSPAQKPAGKSRPDQPFKMKTGSSCELPFLFFLNVKQLKCSENGVVSTRKLTSF